MIIQQNHVSTSHSFLVSFLILKNEIRNTHCLYHIIFIDYYKEDFIIIFLCIYISHILLCFQFIDIFFYYPWNPKLYFYRNLTVSFPLIDSFKIFGVIKVFVLWWRQEITKHHLGTWHVSGKSFITFHFFGLNVNLLNIYMSVDSPSQELPF